MLNIDTKLSQNNCSIQPENKTNFLAQSLLDYQVYCSNGIHTLPMSVTCAVSQAQTTNVATSMAPPFRYNHQQVFCQFGCPVTLRLENGSFACLKNISCCTLHSTEVAGEAEEVTDDAGGGAGGGAGETVKSKLEGGAEGVTGEAGAGEAGKSK